MAKKPYQDSRLAKFLDTRLLELKHLKTQAQIAEEAAFVRCSVPAFDGSGLG
jgi:hypothetical protein